MYRNNVRLFYYSRIFKNLCVCVIASPTWPQPASSVDSGHQPRLDQTELPCSTHAWKPRRRWQDKSAPLCLIGGGGERYIGDGKGGQTPMLQICEQYMPRHLTHPVV